MTNNVLNVFSYETSEILNGYRIFNDCILLQDFRDHKKGEKIESIALQVQLYMWDNNNVLIGDETVIIR